MKHTIETGIDLALSRKAIGKAMDAYKARFADYQPRFDWTGENDGEFSFNAKGVKLSGKIHVRDRAVDVDMHVPLLFRVFQGKAMDVIEEQVKLWVEKAKRGELE
jgi:hypothetical protein